MAAQVVPLQPLRLPKGPSPTTPEQRYWRTFKSPKNLPSPQNAPVTHISHPTSTTTSKKTSASSATGPDASSTDLFAVTSGARVQLISTRTLKPVKTISRFALNDIARSGVLRRDARVLASGSDQGGIQVFDTASRAILKTFKEHRQPVWSVRWHPNDLTSLLSCSDDKSVRLWDLTETGSVGRFTGHEDYVRCGAWMPGGSTVLSGSYDRSVRLWDTRMTGNRAAMCFVHASPLENVVAMPGGTTVASAAGEQIHVLDLVAARPLANLKCHQKAVTSLCLASGGSRVVSGALDGHVKIFDTATWSLVAGAKYPSPILSVGVIPSPASSASETEDRHLAVGLQSGLLSIKTRLSGPQKVAQKERDAEMQALIAGTLDEHDRQQSRKKRKRQTQGMRARLRGLDHDGRGADIVVEGGDRARPKKLTPWDRALRKLQYGRALDLALAAQPPNPPVVLTLLNALHQRSALPAALAHRDEASVRPLLRFLARHVADPRHVVLTSRVALLLLEEYAEHLGKSAEVDELVRRLHESVRRQVDACQVAWGTIGMVELLMGGARNG